MKRFCLTVAIILMSISALAQSVQPSFFGLSFGDVLSKENIAKALDGNGTIVSDDDSQIVFRDVIYNGVTWRMAVFNLDERGSFKVMTFSMVFETETEANKFIETLKGKYDYDFEENNQPGIHSYTYSDSSENTILLMVNEAQNVYLASLAFFAADYESLQSQYTVQDEFFGLKLGRRISETTVKNAIGSRGKYSGKESESGAILYNFTDVQFAGKTWDYAVLFSLSTGELYEVKFYSPFDDNSWNADERREANSLYESYQSKLESKYGEGKLIEEDNGKELSYYGDNEVLLILSSTRDKAKSGEYRRYVGIDYTEMGLYNKLSASIDDEL